MDLQVLGCPEHDLTISGNVCLSVYDKNFVASEARELMNRISGTFIFSVTPKKISVCQLLVGIVQQMVCNQTFSRFFRMNRSQILSDEITQKFIYKMYY